MIHTTVLRKEAVEWLNVRSNAHYIDCTLGAGGHTEEILKGSGPEGKVIAFELDEETIDETGNRLASFKDRLFIERESFRDLEKASRYSLPISGILYDLGFSEDLVKRRGRGLSFQADEPLDMRFDTRTQLRAEEIVNRWSESEIADVIFHYGEERYARRIARRIRDAREKARITTTGELVRIIEGAVPPPYRRGRIHCATRTFQALRIAVNDELDSLKTSLGKAIDLVENGGRIGVISFHSLEDRIVKQTFRLWAKLGLGTLPVKKFIAASDEEVTGNPGARSAKLRIFEKKETSI